MAATERGRHSKSYTEPTERHPVRSIYFLRRARLGWMSVARASGSRQTHWRRSPCDDRSKCRLAGAVTPSLGLADRQCRRTDRRWRDGLRAEFGSSGWHQCHRPDAPIGATHTGSAVIDPGSRPNDSTA